MLCHECDKIVIKPVIEISRKIIRRYSNIWEVKNLASDCDFCGLIYSDTSDLETDSFSYCRPLWGEDLYQKALKIAPIIVHFVNHPKGRNITWEIEIWPSKLEEYRKGPRYGTSANYFGGLCVESESPAAQVLSGRRIDAESPAEAMISLASTWYMRCKNDHDECARTRTDNSPLPKRAIDVTSSSDEKRLLLIHPPKESLGEYAALSYVWGDAPNVLLTKETFEEFTSIGMSFQKLPSTFQDAISLTKSLGIRYLWIDALCIIQHSDQDWKEQSSQMCEIFSQATLVIRAGCGADSQHGLFNVTGRKKREVPLKLDLSMDSLSTCFVRSKLTRGDPLDTRCWALQEQRLAKRFITFGSTEITWECMQAYSDESGTPKIDIQAPGFIIPIRKSLDPTFDGLEALSSPTTQSTATDVWQQLVKEYCRRRLTFTKDRLPAIAGLARYYAKQFVNIGTDKYLAGLWLSQLPKSLLWDVGRTSGHFASKPDNYQAPTWSWASLDWNNINWNGCSVDGEAFTRVIKAEVSLLGPDIYGQVTGAQLVVEGPIKRGLLLPDNLYGDMKEMWAEDAIELYRAQVPGDYDLGLGKILFDLGEPQNSSDEVLYAHCLRITQNAGLVIERQEGVSPVFWKRVGVIEFTESSKPWWEGCENSVVTLV